MGIGPRLKEFRLVADEYERLHPDVTIKFLTQAVVAGGSEGEWIRTRLLGGVAPEIVQINTEAIWPDIEEKKSWWIPLDPYLDTPNPYVEGNERWIDLFANQALTQAKRAPDGKLYCITLDIVETGIFYNQDILDKVNVSLPKDWEDFLTMQEKIKRAGYIPMLISANMYQDWAQDLLFDQCFYEVLDKIDYKKASQIEEGYYQGYLTSEELCWLIEKAWFAPNNPRYKEIWRLMKQWRKYWQLDLTHSDLFRLFITQKAAMFWNGSWFIRRLQLDPLIDFKWAVTYLPPITKETSPYCYGIEQCVIGGAANQFHITRRAVDDGELDIVIDFLMYVTVPANSARIVNEAGMFIPNIKGAPMAENLKPFAEIVKRRYTTAKWMYSLPHRFTDHHQRMIDLFLNDGISLKDFMVEMGHYFHATAEKMIRQHNWKEPEQLLSPHSFQNN